MESKATIDTATKNTKRTKINKPLIPLKIILFCWYGAASCLLPYQTIHMRQLGITVEETAIIYTFLPFTQILGPPIAGIIADRLGRYKPVLLINLVLCIVFASITLLVPAIPPETVVETAVPTLRHSPDDGLQVLFRKCSVTEQCEHVPRTGIPVRMLVSECEYVDCIQDDAVLKMYPPHQSREDEAVLLEKQEISNYTVLWKKAAREESVRIHELPRNVTLMMRLLQQLTPSAAAMDGPEEPFTLCAYSVRQVVSKEEEKAADHQRYVNYFQIHTQSAEFNYQYYEFIRNRTKSSCVLSCSLANVTYDAANEGSPVFRHHSATCVTEIPSRMLTFWFYFVVRILFQTVLNICFSLLDATALALVEHHDSDFGRQRFWAILATAIFSPVTGVAIDFISEYRKYEDYSPAYYFFDALVIFTTLFVGMLDITVAPPEKNVLKNVCKLLRLPEVLAFMMVVFALGTIWGFIESFLFWYLLDLGSPKYLLGLTLTASAVAGLPFLHESQWFVKKIGRVNLLIVALFVYFVRCFGYSYIDNPWWCIPFEGMEVFTYHLMWVAAATYSANLVPKGLLATIQGCVGGLHFGVGRGAGSLIGGYVMYHAGARLAFRIMGIAGGVTGVIYALLYYTVLIKYKDFEEMRKKELEEQLAKKETSAQNTSNTEGKVDGGHHLELVTINKVMEINVPKPEEEEELGLCNEVNSSSPQCYEPKIADRTNNSASGEIEICDHQESDIIKATSSNSTTNAEVLELAPNGYCVDNSKA